MIFLKAALLFLALAYCECSGSNYSAHQEIDQLKKEFEKLRLKTSSVLAAVEHGVEAIYQEMTRLNAVATPLLGRVSKLEEINCTATCTKDGTTRGTQIEKFCPRTYVQYGLSCYKFHTTNRKDWSAARQACQMEGGYMLSIESQSEMEILRRHIGSQPSLLGTMWWIGGSRSGTSWRWESGKDFRYSNWYGGGATPLSKNYDCLTLYGAAQQNEWDSWPCFAPQAFICEIDLTS